MGIQLLGNQCGYLPLNVVFKLFDSKVLPILCYGSEIWGSQILSDIEIVQNQFCKYVLGLGSRSVNVAALAECGRKPLYVHYMTKCIKYWLKLLSMEPGRYPKVCYKMLLNFHSVGSKTWATDIRYILYSNGFGDAWPNYLLHYLSKESLISHIKACMLKFATPQNYIHIIYLNYH